ncbi:MAG: C40 family peptidase [bacterium]|nr:C40 family peptidase [bacterium]
MSPVILAASLIWITPAADPAASPPLPATVQQAIDEFTPLWKPTERNLVGLTIGIHPMGNQPDIELVTAGYLYHYVVIAGGTPVITRPDLSSAAGDAGGGSRTRVLREKGCNACVAIGYSPTHVEPVPGGMVDDDLRSSLSSHVSRAVAHVYENMRFRDSNSACAALTYMVQSLVLDDGAPVTLAQLTMRRGLTRKDADFWELAKANARAIYEGISRYWSQPGNPARSTNGSITDTAGEMTRSPVPDTRTSTVDGRMRRLGRSIWPEGRLPDDRVEWFCRWFSRSAVKTGSLVYFAPEVSVNDGTVVLSGATNAPRTVDGLREALAEVGIKSVRNEMRTLPDRDRLGEERYGACRVPMVLTFDRPSERGALQTQLLFGEPVFLLDRQEGFVLLHGGDGYWGWVRADAVQAMNDSEFRRYTSHPRGVLLNDVVVAGVTIPRGASVPIVTQESGGHLVLLPDGSRHDLPDGAVAHREAESGAAAARVAAALDLVGAPYVFGGRSPLGLDCSGLITNVWARCGEAAARDAWQQALAGSLTATWWCREGMQPGDQVLFINPAGKIYHTGVAISSTHVLHSAPPGVQIGSIKPGDRLYDPRLDRDFFMAKRP